MSAGAGERGLLPLLVAGAGLLTAIVIWLRRTGVIVPGAGK